MKKLFKKLGIFILIGFVVFRTFAPVVVSAEDTQESSDTPTQQQVSQDTPDAESDTPSQSPDPTPSDGLTAPTDDSSDSLAAESLVNPDPSPSPTPDTTVENNADVNNDVASNSDSGNNTASGSAHTGSGSIDTGDAVSSVTAENDVNTTQINSQVYYQTINIYAPSDTDLDLSVPGDVVNDLIKNKNLSSDNINVSMINNSSYVINNISVSSNTGENSGGGNITTGNAYSVVTLLNKVNFTVVNSQVHIVTVNIFGTMDGNIMLPPLTTDVSTCALCGATNVLSNMATVNNNINSQAISGQNTALSSATIDTGDAISFVSLFNLVNGTYINTDYNALFINVFGEWTGNYLGFTNMSPVITYSGLMDTSVTSNNGSDCGCIMNTDLTNSATLENNIESLANTGQNTNAKNIKTGTAISVVSLINFVNTTFINSHSFFGFINIFGKLTGNVGRKDLLVSATPDIQANQGSDEDDEMESGGKFELTSSNNSVNHINPGDTLTEFVKVKNVGTGKIYGTKLSLTLVKDGQSYGGNTFDLGDINGGKAVKLTTGLVIGKSTPQGAYDVVAYVYGDTYEGEVDATSSNSFNLLGGFGYGNNTPDIITVIKTKKLKVLSSAKVPVIAVESHKNQNYAALLVIVFALYLLTEKMRKDNRMLAVMGKKQKRSKKAKRS